MDNNGFSSLIPGLQYFDFWGDKNILHNPKISEDYFTSCLRNQITKLTAAET
jgi:hypothetical protein